MSFSADHNGSSGFLVVTIRAYGDAERFGMQSLAKLDLNAACLNTGYLLNRWLQVRERIPTATLQLPSDV